MTQQNCLPVVPYVMLDEVASFFFFFAFLDRLIYDGLFDMVTELHSIG